MNKNKLFSKLFIIIFMPMILNSFFKQEILAHASDENQTKTIYITFDDGPSYIVTDEILDILKDKGIKATFFVVGYKIQGKENIMKRIHEEGHTIGLHSYTHVYKKVYESEDSVINEMDRTCEEVKKVLGDSPKAIRFPGGSKPHLNKALLERLHQKKYRIYDWNSCISDGLNEKASPESLFRESKKVIGGNSRIILLLHCDQMNKNTCKALPMIIDFYRDNGYEFKAISDDTQELYFRFK